MYGQTLVDLGYDAMARTELIAHFAREIEDFAPHYLEEMRGIAAGADVSFEDIVMVNARTEVVAKARAEKKKAAELEPGDGCTGALILPTRSANGNLIHGQNWDWRAECAETAVVLRVRNDNGPDILTFVEAGGLARSGLNSAGVSITANYLESDRDFRQLGVPLSLIRRKVLEQQHFALAIKAVATTPKSCSNNIMIGMAAGFGVDYECTTDEAFPIYPGADDLIVHANHWVSEVALGKLRDTGRASTPESAYRDWRVRRLLNEKTALTREDLKRPPRPGSHDNLSATVAMVVMEPAAGLMEVAPLPALNRTFTRYSLTAEPELLAAA
jgi:isopenicillin-N N-acyltransferase-like protein